MNIILLRFIHHLVDGPNCTSLLLCATGSNPGLDKYIYMSDTSNGKYPGYKQVGKTNKHM